MKKNALLTAIVVALLAGCNSSDNSSPDRDTTPGNPGIPALPGGGDDGGNQGGDQTDPDGDHDLNPSKDPLIIEAAQRWGTTYEEMYDACQLWTCNLAGLNERITFTIERDTVLLEGSSKIVFTLSDNRHDLWPTFTFYSDLIGRKDIDIEHVDSTFDYRELDSIQREGSTLLGWKTGSDSWVTQDPRNCDNVYCAYLKTSWLENALHASAMAVYRLDGEVTATQRTYIAEEELKALFPIFNANFPSQY
jgi:hypothetical protein